MSHPRIEEVSDSDPDVISDPEEMDLDDFADADIMRRREPAKQQQQQQPSSQPPAEAAAAKQHILNPGNIPQPSGGSGAPRQMTSDDRAAYADYQCLYPVYFDATRSRAQGRRISASLAVRNPLAREIANACSRLRLQTVLEPEKTHPKDWSNPGRVKVALKSRSGSSSNSAANNNISNKHHLYLLIAQHLRENPTTEKSAGLRMRIGGQVQPPEDKPYPKPAVPRGWRMNEFVPYLSAAMTGGGVSENLFGDIMKGMQGGQDPMAALMGGAAGGAGGGSGAGSGNASGAEEGGKKKKDKKKGKA